MVPFFGALFAPARIADPLTKPRVPGHRDADVRISLIGTGEHAGKYALFYPPISCFATGLIYWITVEPDGRTFNRIFGCHDFPVQPSAARPKRCRDRWWGDEPSIEFRYNYPRTGNQSKYSKLRGPARSVGDRCQ